MCAHTGTGIEKGSSQLDRNTFQCIGIVTAPDLGCVVEHTRIETAAAAGTSFDQQVGEGLQEPFMEFIDTHDIAVGNFALLFGGEGGGEDFVRNTGDGR